ncbi:hypothetical protein CBCST_15296 [Clostridium botulinum C str. Stockholm]|nr:hypothetical protein CBCST_15296 [Clostridium botulinum C str. Stockholm]
MICFHKQKEGGGYVPINESWHLTYFLSSQAMWKLWLGLKGNTAKSFDITGFGKRIKIVYVS